MGRQLNQRFSDLNVGGGMFNSVRGLLLFAFYISLSSCFSGGGLTGSNVEGSTAISVLVPTITFPATNPYHSASNQLTISGMCMEDYTVQLVLSPSLLVASAVKCVNSTYQFVMTEGQDGTYAYFISQVDPKGVSSIYVPLLWVRKSSVSIPVVTTPAATPFASDSNVLSISGTCESGATISLQGDGAGSTLCQNSQFAINLSKSVDQDYNIQVVQTDLANNSASRTIVWQKHTLTVSPINLTMTVNTSQVFTLSGGSGSYTVSITDNKSGGNYNSTTRTYTTGTIAGVTDLLQVVDSLGVSKSVSVITVAAAPDHFEYPLVSAVDVSGNNQTVLVGTQLADPLQAKVVDRYGNPISNYPVFVDLLNSDGVLLDSPFQFTSLLGMVTVNLKAGFSHTRYSVRVRSVATVLPDLALSGFTQLAYGFTSFTSGHGNLGNIFKSGQNPNGVAVADFDEDGVKDMIVLNANDPSFSLLLGRVRLVNAVKTGNGLFSGQAKTIGICPSPNGIVARDFNGDGHTDIMISCGNSLTRALQIYLGNGDATFNPAINIAIDTAIENIPNAIALADFDNDGKLDVAISLAGSGRVSVRLGDGTGHFGLPTSIVVGNSPNGIAVGDFNHDGKPDIAVANSADSSVQILRNTSTTGNLNFDNSFILGGANFPVAVAAVDLNGDSFDDLIILNSGDGSVSVQLNDQSGSFYEVSQLVANPGALGLYVGHLNGDGLVDVVVSNTVDSTVSVFFGTGPGLFTLRQTLNSLLGPVAITSADVSGDGNVELFVTGGLENAVQVFAGHGAGALKSFGLDFDLANSPTMTAAADLNGDGKVDMAVLSTAGRSVDLYTSDGNSNFTFLSSLFTNDLSSSIILAPLRSRQVLDVVVTNQSKAMIRIFLNDGAGAFAAPIDVAVGTGPTSVVSGDFNSDGFTDLAVTNSSSNKVSVLLGHGDGTFDAKVDYAVGGAPSAIDRGDVNGDGVSDLIVANMGTNTLSVLMGNGDGTFRAQVDFPTGVAPVAIKVLDINRDGFLDALTTNNGDSTVSVLFGNGDGSFRAHTQYTAGTAPYGLTCGDLNGDGRMEAIVANGSNNAYTILNGTGLGQFNNSTSVDTGGTTGHVLLQDVNGDGELDLISIDSFHNVFRIWTGH